MSTTGRPRKARVSSSGESKASLPYPMGVNRDLWNLRELFSHLLLCHEIGLFENLDAFVREQGCALSISDFKSLDAFVVEYSVSVLHLIDRFFESIGLGAKFVSGKLYSSLDGCWLDCLAKPVCD